MSQFAEQDLLQIREHGLTPEAVELQIENFKRGFPYLKVVKAASPGDGIVVASPERIAAAVERYDRSLSGRRSCPRRVPPPACSRSFSSS